VEWSGPAIDGPGVSTFYTVGDPVALRAAAVTMFGSVIARFPVGGVSWTFPDGGEVLDSETGALKGVWSGPAATSNSASGTANYARGVGARLIWGTGAIAHRRRVVGSTFMVPLTAGAYDVDGTLSSVAYGALNTAAQTFVTTLAGNLIIWTRPQGGTGGGTATVSSGACADKVSWLTSRRR